jgi:metal transporter CNNM
MTCCWSPSIVQVLRRAGSPDQQRQAVRIIPFLTGHSQHQLLVTLLVVNSLVNEALPLALDALVPPLAAVIISVTGVLVMGEIFPQAVCSR